MGSCPCKQSGHPIARLRPNPSGKCLVGRSAVLRRLWIAVLSTAHRALQPIPTRYLRDPAKTANTFLCSSGENFFDEPVGQQRFAPADQRLSLVCDGVQKVPVQRNVGIGCEVHDLIAAAGLGVAVHHLGAPVVVMHLQAATDQ